MVMRKAVNPTVVVLFQMTCSAQALAQSSAPPATESGSAPAPEAEAPPPPAASTPAATAPAVEADVAPAPTGSSTPTRNPAATEPSVSGESASADRPAGADAGLEASSATGVQWTSGVSQTGMGADDMTSGGSYMDRYRPEPNLWELGWFAGVFFPSSDHNLKVPTLPQERYASVAPELGMRFAYFPLSFAGLEAEGAVVPTSTRDTDRSAVLYSGRAQVILQLPYWSVVPFVLGGGGVLGALSRPMGKDSDPMWHFGVGAKAAITDLLSVRLDVRDNLTQKFGAEEGTATHHLEAIAGLTVTLGRTPPPALVVVDSDGDGIADTRDACMNEPGTGPDGCPIASDEDDDGVLDRDDRCLREPGPAPDGCPDPDPDGDGVVLPCDACPDERGVPPDGCPVLDGDGDGILDEADKCPAAPETRNGFEDEDGCPDEVPEEVQKFSGVIQGITFDQGQATIRDESFPVLDAAFEVMKEHPSIRIEVSGHTSSEGADETNQKLSAERAEAVRAYLISKGIDGARIRARGAGSSEPIADNATAEGRQKNRRIEFRILSQP